MGGGPDYSQITRSVRSQSLGYMTKTVHETFGRRSIHPKMDPISIKLRESRDSEEHPISLAILLALDMTGSMDFIPGELVKNGLPEMIQKITEAGIPNPQLLFLGVGDHKCDDAPLQIGQFETSDELMDFWLTNVWIESGGGGNGGESYSLAHYFAAYHTSIDCFEKRQQKGFLFTIGDEPNHSFYAGRDLNDLMGSEENKDHSSAELIVEAQKSYHVYHINIDHGYGSDRSERCWKQLLGERCITVRDHKEIPGIIAKIVGKYTNDDFKVEIVSSIKPTLAIAPDGKADAIML